jgi:hypothetical protein
MAEIKSTLDLVMERTRHLRMTEEDKSKQAAAAFKEAVSRLARKYLDGRISLDKFKAELNQLGGGASCGEEAAAEIGRWIDPDADNTRVLDLMKNGLDFDISGIEAILHHFREKVHSEEDRAVERARVDLLKKGIFGNAVIPGLEADKGWASKRKEMLETVRVELDAQIAQLKQNQ